MKDICCYGGILTQVSDEDFSYLCGFKWHVTPDGYVRGSINKKQVFMHHVIVLNLMKLTILPKMEIDHWDQIKVHNWRENLRVITRRENALNQGIKSNSTTGTKGIHYILEKNKYRVHLYINEQRIHIGYFDTLREAEEAKIDAELKYKI